MSSNILYIEVVSGVDRGKLFKVDETCFIGRTSRCAIQLSDPGIAPMHARLAVRNGIFTLTDLTAEPDIRVNDSMVKSRRLAIGDRVKIAGTVFNVLDEDAGAARSGVAVVDAGPEEDITFVSIEDAPVTRVTLPPQKARGDDHALDASGDVKGDEGAPHMSAIHRHMAERVVVEEQDHEKEMPRPGVRFFVVLVMILVPVLFLSLHVVSVRRELGDKYKTIIEDAEKHEWSQQVTLQKLKELRVEADGKFDRLAKGLDQEIAAIEAELVRKEKEFQALLLDLDARAKGFVEAGDFESALKVYNNATDVVRAQVIGARTNEMVGIERKRDEHREMIEEARRRDEEQQQNQIREKANESLIQLLSDVVDAVLESKVAVAIKLLDEALADKLFAPAGSMLESAMTTVRLVDAYDRLKSSLAGDVLAAGKIAVAKSELHPIARALLSLRDNELLEAKTFLVLDMGHVMWPAIQSKMQVAGESMADEKSAVRMFFEAWKRIDASSGNKIPSVDICVRTVDAAVKYGKQKEIESLCAELINCSIQFAGTDFVRLYAPLFDKVRQLYPSMLVQNDVTPNPGNGKVIQVSGSSIFVESASDLTAIADGSVGLFATENIFFSIGSKSVPVALALNVYAVVPFQMLSSRQLKFLLPSGVSAPEAGQSVMISRGIRKGYQIYDAGISMDQRSVFIDDFTTNHSNKWTGVKGSYGIETERMYFASQPNPKPGELGSRKAMEGDLVLKVDAGRGVARLEFEMIRESEQSVAVVIGNFSFVIGNNGGTGEGIYFRGSLVASGTLIGNRPGNAEKVVISINRSAVALAVNDSVVFCNIAPSDLGDTSAGILFYSGRKVFLDNVNFRVVSEDETAKISGLSADGRDVIVLRAGSREWDNVRTGQSIYFMRKDSSGDIVPYAEGIVLVRQDYLLLCRVGENFVLDGSCKVSLTKEGQSATGGDLAVSIDELVLRKTQTNTLSLVTALDNGDLKFKLDLPVRFPAQGFLYPFSEHIMHPQTLETLAVSVGAGTKCAVRQTGSVVDCSLLGIAARGRFSARNGLLSSQFIQPGSLVDVSGFTVSSPPGGYSAVMAEKSFWIFPSQAWRVSNGRLLSHSSSDILPTMVAVESFPGNVQYDVQLRLEEPLRNLNPAWIKDVMFELYFPARQTGVTFGIGCKDDGGLLVSGRTISMLEGASRMGLIGSLPSDAEIQIAGLWRDSTPFLNYGKEYFFRIRRVGDAMCFYVNGMRLAYVRIPGVQGDVQLRMAAPETRVSVGLCSAKDLPESCRLSPVEAELGDFGYVLKTLTNRILIDSDTTGIALKGAVSCMAVENVIQGDISKTIILKKVASGSVVEIGPRTSVVALSGLKPDVKPGMKIMAGVQPDSLVITQERLRDIDLGL